MEEFNISIIVPIFNVEKYLHDCLQSLVKQSLKKIEIILVDDGSTDSSGNIADEYARKYERIIVIHKKNGGQSSARNKGLSIARGKYILFVDSDDYILEDTCKILFNSAEKYNVDIVNADTLNDKNNIINSEFRRIGHENQKISTDLFLKEKLETCTYDIVPFLYMVKREYLIKNNITFLEGVYYEDQLYTFELLTNIGSIVKIRYPFYYYRMNRIGSTTNNITLKNLLDQAKVCNKMFDYRNNILKESSNQKKKMLDAVIIISLFQLYNVWKKSNKNNKTVLLENIDYKYIFNKIQPGNYYLELQKELKFFIYHRKYVEIKLEIKKLVKKMIGR